MYAPIRQSDLDLPDAPAHPLVFRVEVEMPFPGSAIGEGLGKAEQRRGRTITARGARTDIIMASVEAVLEGINRLIQQEQKKS